MKECSLLNLQFVNSQLSQDYNYGIRIFFFNPRVIYYKYDFIKPFTTIYAINLLNNIPRKRASQAQDERLKKAVNTFDGVLTNYICVKTYVSAGIHRC